MEPLLLPSQGVELRRTRKDRTRPLSSESTKSSTSICKPEPSGRAKFVCETFSQEDSTRELADRSKIAALIVHSHLVDFVLACSTLRCLPPISLRMANNRYILLQVATTSYSRRRYLFEFCPSQRTKIEAGYAHIHFIILKK